MDDGAGYMILWISLGLLFGILLSCIIIIIISPIQLSQETGDDICQQITENEAAEATAYDNKLTCIIPSFDKTQNIIIRTNEN